jgi:hypothetical protein
VPGYFSGSPAFELPDPGAILIMPPSERPVLGSEQIENAAWTVQRHELAVFAHRAGRLSIPGFNIRLQFKRAPLDKEAISTTVKTGPIAFTVKSPPGAEALGSLISARDLTAIETWLPEPGTARAGDAFTRTVTVSAPSIPAMAFPPFPARTVDGLALYPKAPQLVDHDERGSMRGERRDTAVYLCQRAGHFIIPAARLTWFDLEGQRLRVIEFPARRFDVAPNAAMLSASQETITSMDTGWRHFLAGLIGAAGANAILLSLWTTRARWRPWFACFRAVHLSPLNPEVTP